jgi:protein TonB
MVHAHAAHFRPTLDPKRIAATSAVIALHVGVLMMLMMPMQRAQTVSVEEEAPPYIPVKIVPPKVIPPPPKAQPQPQTRSTPRPDPIPIPDPPPQIYTDNPTYVDVAPTPEVTTAPTTFEATASSSPFVELATRMSPPPAYPRLAITRGWSGTVLLRIHVDASGKPMEVTIEQSSGHDLLDQAAIKVVKAKWLFVPATQDGVPTDAWARVPVEFVLN